MKNNNIILNEELRKKIVEATKNSPLLQAKLEEAKALFGNIKPIKA